ncbi:hypothetical protein QE439_002108 [Pedobacter agri]|nr:hypothetical protein [Pedobacter agri]
MFFKIVTTIPPNDGVNRITIANEPQNPNFVDLPKFAKIKHIPMYRIKMMISPVKPTGISLFDDASKPLFNNREKNAHHNISTNLEKGSLHSPLFRF